MPYDVVALAIFMTAVWLILTDRYLALMPVFILGTLNRETSIFIPIFLGLYSWFSTETRPSARGRWARWRVVGPYVAVQVLLWVALRLWIRELFIHNPLPPDVGSGWFGLHLAGNLKSLAKPQQWPLFLSVFGFTLPLFIAKFDMIGDRALSRATAVVLVLWTASMLFVGVIVEIRIFNELTAFLAPCVGLILWNQWVRPARWASGVAGTGQRA